MQPLQQSGLPSGALWPPCTQIVFNIGMAPPYYPTMGPMPPWQPQFLPQLQEMTTISREHKEDGNKMAARDVDKGKAAPADLSAEDEKTLIDALKRWKVEDGLTTLQQVFEELGQVCIRVLNVVEYMGPDR